MGGTVLLISLPNTKGGMRRGCPEKVLVYDRLVITLASKILANASPVDRLLPGGWRALSNGIHSLGKCFGLVSKKLTPYCLRRGGATWHFLKYSSLDATQALGRWQQAKTAKIYIDQAAADLNSLSVPEWGRVRLQRAAAGIGLAVSDFLPP